MEPSTIYKLLYLGGDIQVLRQLEGKADADWKNLIEACNASKPDPDKIVSAAESYAVSAHDCDEQREFIVSNVSNLGEEAKKCVLSLAKGPHDGNKARTIYQSLAPLIARTKEEDRETWDSLFDDIPWVNEGLSITYDTKEQVEAAKSKALALSRSLVLGTIL